MAIKPRTIDIIARVAPALHGSQLRWMHQKLLAKRLDEIAERLVRLLRGADEPETEMRDLLRLFEENGIWNGPMTPSTLDNGWPKFHAFAENVIVENWLLQEVLSEQNHIWEPRYCETVGDLVSHLLPHDEHLS